MKDEIIAEVWRNRDLLAERYGHNLDAIVAAMKKRQRRPLTKAAGARKSSKSSLRSVPKTGGRVRQTAVE